MTNVNRWHQLATSPTHPSWTGRNDVVAKLIKPNQTVLDVGAGTKSLRELLPAGCSYQAMDCVAADNETIVFDFNHPPSTIPTTRYDVVVASGVMEYIFDPERFVSTICSWTDTVILTYATAERRKRPENPANGWVNDLSSKQVIALMNNRGFNMQHQERWKGQTVFLFEKPKLTKEVTYDNRWKYPRLTIASSMVDNDFAYASSGAFSAIWCIKKFNILPEDAQHMTILDYGCGTGRVSRFFGPFFKRVIAYDPSHECIEHALEETKMSEASHPTSRTPVTFKNVTFTSNIGEVPECDVAVCINVIEHLKNDQAELLVRNLIEKVKGETVFSYKLERHLNLLSPYLTEDQINHDVAEISSVRKINFRNGKLR